MLGIYRAEVWARRRFRSGWRTILLRRWKLPRPPSSWVSLLISKKLASGVSSEHLPAAVDYASRVARQESPARPTMGQRLPTSSWQSTHADATLDSIGVRCSARTSQAGSGSWKATAWSLGSTMARDAGAALERSREALFRAHDALMVAASTSPASE
jgi:hypothetical protein